MKKFYLAVSICMLYSFGASAQSVSVTGLLLNEDNGKAINGANVLFANNRDTTSGKGGVSNEAGVFVVDNLRAGRYMLRISHISYKTYQMPVMLKEGKNDLGTIVFKPTAKMLKDVEIQANAVKVEISGDTTQYRADGFKINPDASTQDLITKMPGITVENGTVKAQGEEVKRVLVDGKQFFGDDPNMALKNLPAEIVDKIQVFDQLSDQSQFTGFDDGNSVKTMNIVTRSGNRNGQFGKFYGGYGTDDRFSGGLSLNLFNGARKITILGLSNNINQQNFAVQDLMGAMGGGGHGRRGGGLNNFMVGQQNGITKTHAFGFNYADEWNNKMKINGSYFVNYSDNKNISELVRDYVSGRNLGQKYYENSDSKTENLNHRFNFRFDYDIDSSNSLLIRPSFTYQDNNKSNMLDGRYLKTDSTLMNQTISKDGSNQEAISFSNNILWRHKLGKKGRTFSINIGTDYNNRNGSTNLLSQNIYHIPFDSIYLIDQNADIYNEGYTLSANISYTEPLGKNGQLEFNYNPSYNYNDANKETFERDTVSNLYNIAVNSLSNVYVTRYTFHRSGISYRYRLEELNFHFGFQYQYAELNGDQTLPYTSEVNKTFKNILPNAMLNYRFSKTNNLRVYYRSSTRQPSVSQLQDVVDNSNNLLVSTGNPDLKQEYSQMLMARYSAVNPKNSNNFFIMFNVQNSMDYIGTSTITIDTITQLPNGYTMLPGTQLSMPVNLNGYWSLRSFVTYGVPVKWIKSSININSGVNWSRSPGLVNMVTNYSNTTSLTAGLVIASNISPKVDFTLSTFGNYNIVKNSLNANLDNNYHTQVSSIRFNWIFGKNFVFNTDMNHMLYTGLDDAYNQSLWLWNASFGKKIFANQRGEIKLGVSDILGQNQSISRNVTSTYLEDVKTNSLQRYIMLTFTYNLRNFQSKNPPDADRPPFMMMQGMRPPHEH
ncbi:MAG: outer membrane beta-barrel protein [Bacteroidales bacterium]|nr:outer membrane beta-barrel protein [Bacteroidales bacterium]